MVGAYRRFTFADGAQGIVQVGRGVSVVEDEFMLSFYDNLGSSHIVNAKGDVLICSQHKDGTHDVANVMDSLRMAGNEEEEIQHVCDSMEREEEGVSRFFFRDEEHVFAYTPIENSDGWYVFVIIPDSVIMKNANDILKSSQTFIFLFSGIFIMAGLFIYMGQHSHRRLMEKEGDLKYREQLFSILANNTNDVFLMFTTDDYTIEYISPNVERVLGIPQEEARKDIGLLNKFQICDREKVNGQIEELDAEGSVSYEGEWIHKKSGERRWFRGTVYITSVNDSKRYVAVLSDRTQERQNQQTLTEALEIAKSANESKSVFLSNMSHDIRTPMNAIVGFSALMQRDANNPDKVREYTRKIASSSQHLLGLINDVLDMSKIESGKTTLNISEISLAQLVEELMSMMQPQAKAKHQDFKIYVRDICNEEVLGDRLRINQILINIISNALKYTPENGKVEMTVMQLPQRTKNFGLFRFIISDNGIGMSKEYLETIFQPFSRETTKKTLGIQGTGLGMAITKNLVDLMGGTIEVKSELDKGSVFTLDLELRIREGEIDPEFWQKHGLTRLLVVDDEEDICKGIRYAMADTGVQIEYAPGGLPAVAMAQKAQDEGNGYNLMLIDWQMPDINGIETARRIRKIVPSEVPIMILSAYDLSEVEEEGIEAGIDGFMPKPFFLSNFRNLVDNLKTHHNTKEESEEQDDILSGKRILAAEDIDLNVEILIELLKMAGAECEWAKDGREAVEKFEQSVPGYYDLILMDVQMPVMNGYDATKAIRQSGHSQAETVPIIAMTANAFSEDVKDALDAGMNAHVAKPIDMEQLKAAAREVFG
ncbi:MAG: response regulator [Lachnospiraceae bacterium]|nr:response regulator [Lachnospiraceae bacterium]